MASLPAALITLAVLVAALITKTILQGAARLTRRGTLRLLDVVVMPLFIVFLIVVVERFRDLS